MADSENIVASYLSQTGRWLPYDHEVLQQWLSEMVIQVDDRPKPLAPAVLALKQLIESDTVLFMHVSSMFEQVPTTAPYDFDGLGRPQLRDYRHMLQVMNMMMTSAPKWDASVHNVGWIGFPLNVILNWPMSTPSGKAFFLDERVNSAIKGILCTWAEYLVSPDSANVLSTKDGWLSPSGLHALMDVANPGAGETPKFEQVFVCDPSLPHYGFKSWDDFFTRQFRPGARPVARSDKFSGLIATELDSCHIITNACESRPYRLKSNVAQRDTFWVKDQPYSLIDMLAEDELASCFVGGTVYQAFLSGLSYHRWHSPVSGTVVKTKLQPGTYYSKAVSQGFGSTKTSLSPSQGYLAEVATRAMIYIDADSPDIGLMCVMPIGMAEVSTCEITIKEGQRVQKGEELGMFHYGGSTYCMLFGPHVELEWVPDARTEHSSMDEPRRRKNLLLNGQLATVKPKTSRRGDLR